MEEGKNALWVRLSESMHRVAALENQNHLLRLKLKLTLKYCWKPEETKREIDAVAIVEQSTAAIQTDPIEVEQAAPPPLALPAKIADESLIIDDDDDDDQPQTPQVMHLSNTLSNLKWGFKKRESKLKKELSSYKSALQSLHANHEHLRSQFKTVCNSLCDQLDSAESVQQRRAAQHEVLETAEACTTQMEREVAEHEESLQAVVEKVLSNVHSLAESTQIQFETMEERVAILKRQMQQREEHQQQRLSESKQAAKDERLLMAMLEAALINQSTPKQTSNAYQQTDAPEVTLPIPPPSIAEPPPPNRNNGTSVATVTVEDSPETEHSVQEVLYSIGKRVDNHNAAGNRKPLSKKQAADIAQLTQKLQHMQEEEEMRKVMDKALLDAVESTQATLGESLMLINEYAGDTEILRKLTLPPTLQQSHLETQLKLAEERILQLNREKDVLEGELKHLRMDFEGQNRAKYRKIQLLEARNMELSEYATNVSQELEREKVASASKKKKQSRRYESDTAESDVQYNHRASSQRRYDADDHHRDRSRSRRSRSHDNNSNSRSRSRSSNHNINNKHGRHRSRSRSTSSSGSDREGSVAESGESNTDELGKLLLFSPHPQTQTQNLGAKGKVLPPKTATSSQASMQSKGQQKKTSQQSLSRHEDRSSFLSHISASDHNSDARHKPSARVKSSESMTRQNSQMSSRRSSKVSVLDDHDHDHVSEEAHDEHDDEHDEEDDDVNNDGGESQEGGEEYHEDEGEHSQDEYDENDGEGEEEDAGVEEEKGSDQDGYDDQEEGHDDDREEGEDDDNESAVVVEDESLLMDHFDDHAAASSSTFEPPPARADSNRSNNNNNNNNGRAPPRHSQSDSQLHSRRKSSSSSFSVSRAAPKTETAPPPAIDVQELHRTLKQQLLELQMHHSAKEEQFQREVDQHRAQAEDVVHRLQEKMHENETLTEANQQLTTRLQQVETERDHLAQENQRMRKEVDLYRTKIFTVVQQEGSSSSLIQGLPDINISFHTSKHALGASASALASDFEYLSPSTTTSQALYIIHQLVTNNNDLVDAVHRLEKEKKQLNSSLTEKDQQLRWKLQDIQEKEVALGRMKVLLGQANAAINTTADDYKILQRQVTTLTQKLMVSTEENNVLQEQVQQQQQQLEVWQEEREVYLRLASSPHSHSRASSPAGSSPPLSPNIRSSASTASPRCTSPAMESQNSQNDTESAAVSAAGSRMLQHTSSMRSQRSVARTLEFTVADAAAMFPPPVDANVSTATPAVKPASTSQHRTVAVLPSTDTDTADVNTSSQQLVRQDSMMSATSNSSRALLRSTADMLSRIRLSKEQQQQQSQSVPESQPNQHQQQQQQQHGISMRQVSRSPSPTGSVGSARSTGSAAKSNTGGDRSSSQLHANVKMLLSQSRSLLQQQSQARMDSITATGRMSPALKRNSRSNSLDPSDSYLHTGLSGLEASGALERSQMSLMR